MGSQIGVSSAIGFILEPGQIFWQAARCCRITTSAFAVFCWRWCEEEPHHSKCSAPVKITSQSNRTTRHFPILFQVVSLFLIFQLE